MAAKALAIICAAVALGLIGTPVPVGQVEASVATDGRSMGFQVFDNPPHANDVVIATTDGAHVRLSDLGGSVVLLNFWRKNCPYCELEKGYLKRLKQSLKTPDLKVICVNFWDEPSWIRRYAAKKGGDLLFAVQPDNGEKVLENKARGQFLGYYLLNGAGEAIYEIKGFPSTYVIDKEGRVIASHLGMARWHVPPVREWIARLLEAHAPLKTPTSAKYELPWWMDRLLNPPVDRLRLLDGLSGEEAEAGNSR